jgi:hypothetical protein
MSLYLALLEDENKGTLSAQQRLFESAYLPRLDRNIRCGNSLLGTTDVPTQVLFGGADLRRRVNPFDWRDPADGFGAVFTERGGFDAVIGNPPYTRTQVLRRYRPEETDAYAATYRSASTGSFDIASPFIERGLSLLRPDGRLGFIVSRQFCETDSGGPLRTLLAESRAVQEIIDFGAGLVFEDVSAYTIILIAGLKRTNKFRLTRVPSPPSSASLAAAEAAGSPLAAELPASTLTSEEWNLDLPVERELLGRLARDYPALRDVCGNVVFQGVVTGADYIYRLNDLGPHPDDPTLRRIARRDSGREGVEDELLRPVYGGRTDVRRFISADASEVLLLPYGRPGRDSRFALLNAATLGKSFPHGWAWLREHEAELRLRGGDWTPHNWWGYSRRQNLEWFDEPKILVPYMIDHLCAHHDKGHHYFVNVSTGGYGIPDATVEDPDYLTALLNSRLLSWALRRYSRAFRGDWFAARKGNLVRLPIADAVEGERAAISGLFVQCQTTRQGVEDARSDADRSRAERLHRAATERFDRAVENLYAVTEVERALIAGED